MEPITPADNSNGQKPPRPKTRKTTWLTVGVKLMIGVGLISNLCIGLLVYLNYTVSSQISAETTALLDVNSAMNENLRASIFDMQKKYLAIPQLLEQNPSGTIMDWVRKNYTVTADRIITGRDNYTPFFNRSQRRDLSKGHFVVRKIDGGVVVFKGMLNADGKFSEAVQRVDIAASDPAAVHGAVTAFIQNAGRAADNPDALRSRIVDLKNLLADEAIASETSRNEILYKVEEIEKKKQQLFQYRKERRQTSRLVAGITVLANIFLLYALAWYMVEIPLRRLTVSIDRINSGEIVDIPYVNRKDRFGRLAGALVSFQDALVDLRVEDDRKKMEQTIISDLITQMSRLITSLRQKAAAMKSEACTLSDLARKTEEQVGTATESTVKTVTRTDSVSRSTGQLKLVVREIGQQVTMQYDQVKDINDIIRVTRDDIRQLAQASTEINDIVNIVRNIAGETKLLALNARIEAARSGDAGKGFAVVAREVRDLSEQTESANLDIARRIASIQTAAQTMVEHTGRIEARIVSLLEASQQISASVEEQSSVTAGIAENAQATATDIRDVSGRISEIRDAAQATNRFAGDVQSHSEAIVSELEILLLETTQKLSGFGRTDNTTVLDGNRECDQANSHIQGGMTDDETSEAPAYRRTAA